MEQDRIQLPELEQSADPYSVLDGLRESNQPLRVRLHDGRSAWLVMKYADVRAGLADSRLCCDPMNTPRGHGRTSLSTNDDILSADAPDHPRLRESIAPHFSVAQVTAMRKTIERVAIRLVDSLPADRPFDIVSGLALPLSTAITCHILGIPIECAADLQNRAAVLMLNNRASEQARESAYAGMIESLEEIISVKREALGRDILGALARIPKAKLSRAELLAMTVTLFIGGYDSTVSFIGASVLALLENPDQLLAIKQDGFKFEASAIDELIRFDGPMMLGPYRYASVDMELGGAPIAAGDLVFLSAAAANHDPGQFHHPERLDLNRNPRHVGFGHGPHYCVGAHLARLEAQIALEVLFRRFEALALVGDRSTLNWRFSVFRGPSALYVTGAPAGGRTCESC